MLQQIIHPPVNATYRCKLWFNCLIHFYFLFGGTVCVTGVAGWPVRVQKCLKNAHNLSETSKSIAVFLSKKYKFYKTAWWSSLVLQRKINDKILKKLCKKQYQLCYNSTRFNNPHWNHNLAVGFYVATTWLNLQQWQLMSPRQVQCSWTPCILPLSGLNKFSCAQICEFFLKQRLQKKCTITL